MKRPHAANNISDERLAELLERFAVVPDFVQALRELQERRARSATPLREAAEYACEVLDCVHQPDVVAAGAASRLRAALATAPPGREEITPEMAEAGAEALAGFSELFEGPEAWARRVYAAMRATLATAPPEATGTVTQGTATAHASVVLGREEVLRLIYSIWYLAQARGDDDDIIQQRDALIAKLLDAVCGRPGG